MSRTQRTVRLIAPFILAASALVVGCRDFGAGGTGEYVVQPERLRDIEAVDLADAPTVGPAATQPFVLATTQPATQLAQVPITLDEVRRWAIENNLQLKVDLLDPTIARQSVTQEQARFEALFTTDARYGTTDTPFLSTDDSGNRVIRTSGTEFFTVVPGLQVPLQTGGAVVFSLPFNRLENTIGRIDPTTGLPQSSLEFASDLSVTVSHPLLRGAGIVANAAPIQIAFYRYQSVEARTKLSVITVLSDVDRQYWRLDGALKLLAVQKRRYDSASDLWGRAKRRFDAGAGIEPDVLQAEAAVADAALSLVAAESAVRGETRELKRIINTPEFPLNSRVLLIPSSEPRFLVARLDADVLADQAVRDRMDILEAELIILQQTAAVRLARNDLLPLLDVSYRYNANGIGETASDSFELLRDNDFADHSVGLSLQIPLGNADARARLRAALANRQQALATRNLREQSVRAEVYLAVQNLEQSWQAILAARQRVYAESRVLESETRKFDRGEGNSEDVRLARDRLSQAQDQEVRAVRDYQISQIDVAAATGTLLGAANVQWTPINP